MPYTSNAEEKIKVAILDLEAVKVSSMIEAAQKYGISEATLHQQIKGTISLL
jgi:predicted DNA-binding protein (UPF0251 family)